METRSRAGHNQFPKVFVGVTHVANWSTLYPKIHTQMLNFKGRHHAPKQTRLLVAFPTGVKISPVPKKPAGWHPRVLLLRPPLHSQNRWWLFLCLSLRPQASALSALPPTRSSYSLSYGSLLPVPSLGWDVVWGKVNVSLISSCSFSSSNC